jgi:tetratricopeptide (TPR) repeat protein
VIAHLDHPGIVTIYDVGQAEGCMFLVMRLVDGPGLDVWLADRGRLPCSEAVAVVKGVAEGLYYAHGQSILHRDLKPANILLDAERGLLLSDFGLAKLMGENSLSQSGDIVGTPHYIAPEVWDGRPATPQTDIYALGCILYEMLTGEKLFPGESPPAVMMAHFSPLTLPPTWPEGVPPGLTDVLKTALAQKASERYATAGEMIEALATLTDKKLTETSAAEIITPSPPHPFISSPRPTLRVPPFLEPEAGAAEAEVPVFVARERELAELEAVSETAWAGQGQILFVIGGAGQGKTMLVQEFARRAQAADPDLMVVSGYCNAHTGLGDPYLPFREALTMLTGEVEAKWAGGLITRQHARRLWAAMSLTLPALVEHAPDLIGSFVSAKTLQERAATSGLAKAAWFKQLTTLLAAEQRPALEQKRLFVQYTAALKAMAAQRPLLLIIEDLHWVDSSSSALLFHLSRQVGDSRILIVGTYRPEEVALSWGEERHPMAEIVSELKRQHGDIWLDLGGLAPIEGRHFVDAYLDTQPNRLDEAFRKVLYQHTGGHALFTVELLREMQDRGDLQRDDQGYWLEGEVIDWHTLPAKVEGTIEKRINRLTEELQAVLTVASVEGEFFTAEVIARVQQVNERGLVRQLSRELDRRHRLVTAQALEWLAKQRLSLYRFRHQLFQHYLYDSLDEMERAYLHEEIGLVLETLYGEQSEQVAVQLARHFQEAGLTEKAIEYLRQAGERARRLSANKEAIAHFTQALALLETLPDTPERTQQELTIQIALGTALIATQGFAAPEVGKTYARARVLCQQVGETPQLLSVLHGLHRYYIVRAEYQTARELGEQVLHLAQGEPDPTFLVPAHRVLGSSSYYMGEFGPAQEHFEQGVALYQPQQHQAHVLLYGQDEGVACLSYAALLLWYLGYPDQAFKRIREALSLARELSHPYSLAYALTLTVWLHRCRRERQATQERAEALIALATEMGFSFFLAMGTFLRGWALAVQGQGQEGLIQMRQGLAGHLATGANLGQASLFPVSLAEAYGNVGQIKAGLAVLLEALTMAHSNGERCWEAELYRLKGELLLKAVGEGGSVLVDDELSPEACFLKAIEVAHQQEAKLYELRATVSLSRLWQGQGQAEEARQMLTKIYDWFTEGFDTPDLTEAKALLETLA